MRDIEALDLGRITNYYSWGNHFPLKPSPFVIEFGEAYIECVRSMCDTLFSDQVLILSGYYASDIDVALKDIPSFFKDKTQMKTILTLNLLLFEFSRDLFAFERHKDLQHFYAIFGKYMPQLVGDPGDKILEFIEISAGDFAQLSEKEEYALNIKTLAVFNFILMHEFAHKNQSIVDATLRLLRSSEDYSQMMDSLDQKQQIEVACDVFSLYCLIAEELPLYSSMKKNLNCNATELLAGALIVQQIDPLLQLLKYCFRLGAEIDHLKIEDLFEKVFSQLNARCEKLAIAAKYMINTPELSASNLDVGYAILSSGDLIGRFMNCLKDALQQIASFIDESNRGNSGSSYTRLVQPLAREEIWFSIK